MLLERVARTSAAVAASPGRLAKVAEIAALLRQAAPEEIPAAVAFLSGELTQRQIGVGYAAIVDLLGPYGGGGPSGGPDLPPPPGEPTLTVADADEAFGAIGRLAGVMTEAIAAAADVPAAAVRRAHQVSGSLALAATAALGDPGAAGGGPDALRAVSLQVGRPAAPMLAATAPAVAAAMERISPAAVEWKIDGIRIQLHRSGDEVRVFTRTLDDITARVPEIAAAARSLSAVTAVLDGEAVALAPDGRPRPFQVTSARTASQGDPARLAEQTPLTPFLFDLLHADGTDLLDAPAS